MVHALDETVDDTDGSLVHPGTLVDEDFMAIPEHNGGTDPPHTDDQQTGFAGQLDDDIFFSDSPLSDDPFMHGYSLDSPLHESMGTLASG